MNTKNNGSLSYDKCTINIPSGNNVSVIITMDIYSHATLKIYVILFNSVFFYYSC
jgi:hypothetical protein